MEGTDGDRLRTLRKAGAVRPAGDDPVSRKRASGSSSPGRDVRPAILRAARRQFVARGFSHVGMRDIAVEAGVDPVLIYRNFASKTGLFMAVLDQCSEAVRIETAEPAALAQQMTELALFAQAGAPERDLMEILGRSLNDEDSCRCVVQAFVRAWAFPLERLVRGEDRAERALAALALLGGMRLARDLLEQPLGSAVDDDRLARLLRPLFEALIAGRDAEA